MFSLCCSLKLKIKRTAPSIKANFDNLQKSVLIKYINTMAESSKKISVNVKTPKDKQTFEIDEDADVSTVSYPFFTQFTLSVEQKKIMTKL